MVRQRIAGAVGCGQHFDVELLEHPARAERGIGQPFGDLIVHGLSRFARQFDTNAEDRRQFMVQPHSGRRAAEEVEMLGEGLPDFPVVRFHRAAVPPRDPQPLQRDVLRIQHAVDVMIGNDQ